MSLPFLYLAFVRVLPLLRLLRRDNGELAIVLGRPVASFLPRSITYDIEVPAGVKRCAR
jgi:hypothetical protein